MLAHHVSCAHARRVAFLSSQLTGSGLLLLGGVWYKRKEALFGFIEGKDGKDPTCTICNGSAKTPTC